MMTTSPLRELRLDRKTILVTVAFLMVGLGLLRFTLAMYNEKVAALEAKKTILFAQQKSSKQLPSLQRELALLERQHKQAGALLFEGTNADTITSTVQIHLQSLIAAAGLEPESLRPVGGKGPEGTINTISIKLRLNGTLQNLAQFLAALYSNNRFFLVESCTLKPQKLKEVKAFIDLKAFYRTPPVTPQAATAGLSRRRP
ncbi:MAG: hypothetical protein C0613_00890 [Desulfobulbaceae bacterium]|nr:MAG: hypothetical protein C0613_00890 [Desulfobulbaceae bacterium]